MNHIAVIYWSGTGNTEAMAKAVLKGAGVGAELFSVSDFDESKIDSFDAFALGCPAMGSEALEDGEFEPFFENVKPSLAGKKVALFGSYGWGDGEWMRSWEAPAPRRASRLPSTASSATTRPTVMLWRPARPSAPRLSEKA